MSTITTSDVAWAPKPWPLCQGKPICWKAARYYHSDGQDYGDFYCGEHHKGKKEYEDYCTHLIMPEQRPTDRLGLSLFVCCFKDWPIVQCNECKELFCYEHWTDHLHDFMPMLGG